MVDIAAYAAHPDDLELSIGGTLALHARKGYSVVGVDLTKGEMGTNGTPEIRLQEAEAAAKILGLEKRINLGLPDLGVEVNNQYLKKVVESLRMLQPRILIAPYWESHHPDHSGAGRLLERAAFVSGLARFKTDSPPFRPEYIYFFALPRNLFPTLVVDVSECHEVKLAAIKAHASQINPGSSARPTLLNRSGFLDRICTKDTYWGQQAGCRYGEPLFCKKVPLVADLFSLKGGGAR